MKVIKIPIIERRSTQAQLFDKLPLDAKKLFIIISKLNKDNISLNDIRNLGMFGDTQAITRLLYTLESRGFGEVKVNGVETNFIPNKVLMLSVQV